MKKDLKFEIISDGWSTAHELYKSRVKIYFGDKHIIEVSVWNEDVAKIKASLFALQAEMQKDVIQFLLDHKIEQTKTT